MRPRRSCDVGGLGFETAGLGLLTGPAKDAGSPSLADGVRAAVSGGQRCPLSGG